MLEQGMETASSVAAQMQCIQAVCGSFASISIKKLSFLKDTMTVCVAFHANLGFHYYILRTIKSIVIPSHSTALHFLQTM